MTDATPRPPIGGLAEDPTRLARAARPDEYGAPHPLYVVWEITLACDLGCKTCGSRAGPRRDTELDTEACLDAVAQMADLGIREVTLIGGEAYLREDWDLIAAEITRRGMTAGITTGARNLTPERIARAVDAGVAGISISLDGLERTHDAQRGSPGSWKAAVEAARRVAVSPMRLSTNTQINRLSMPELVGVADLLAEIGSAAWQIQITVPMGRGADRPDMLLQPHDLLELFPLLAWIKQERLTPAGIRLFPGNNIGYFGPWEQVLRYGGGEGAHWGGCGAGKWCLGVEADGKIKGCPSLPSEDWTGGFFGQDRLAEVVADTDELRFLRERTRDDLWGFCKTCYYADVCRAGCTWTSQCTLGEQGNNPYCIHRALWHDERGQRERLVHRQPAPGKPFDHGRFDILVEDAPPLADAGATIAGFDLPTVTGLKWDAGSVWQPADLKRLLKRIGRRDLVQITPGGRSGPS